MTLFLTLLMFVSLTGVITAFGYRKYVRPSRIIDRLAEADEAGPGARFVREKPGAATAKDGVVVRSLAALGRLLPLSPGELAIEKKRVIAAGIRSELAAEAFCGARVLASVALLGAVVLGRGILPEALLPRMALIAGFTWLGYTSPSLVLDQMIRRRREQVRFSLPEVLDMLVICTEAGCGLDQAIVNVSRELANVHPAICEELATVNLEILAGVSRADALRGFAERTGEDEAKKLVAILLQTDRFGTSVADALRTQSDFLRVRRRQEAEERAGKVGVKLVFPIFFFCLPSLLVVTAGPGILQLLKNLFPMMREFH